MICLELEKISLSKTGKLHLTQAKSEVGVIQLEREKSEIGELQIEPQKVASMSQEPQKVASMTQEPQKVASMTREHIKEHQLMETPKTTSKTDIDGNVDKIIDRQTEPLNEGEVIEQTLAEDIVDTKGDQPISSLEHKDTQESRQQIDDHKMDDKTEEELTQAKKEELERVLQELKALDKKRKYPIAPDGYIPNSVIRKLYKIVQPDIVMKKKTPWKLKSVPMKQPKKDVLEGDELSDVSESYEPFYFDDSEEEKLIFSSTEEEEEEEAVTATDSEAATVDKTSRPKVVKMKKKKPLEIPQTDFNQWSRAERKSGTRDVGGKAVDSSILEEDQEEETDEKTKSEIDPLLQEIVEQSWFPARNPATLAGIAIAFASLLQRVKAPVFKEVCDYIVQVQKKLGFPPTNLDNLLRKLAMQLKNVDAAIRAFAAKAMGRLGVNRDEVLLGLLQALADDDDEVRYVTAEALKMLANVQNKDDLLALMEKLGAIKDVKSKDNEDAAMISLTSSESLDAIGDMVQNWIDVTAGGDKRDEMDKDISSVPTKDKRSKGRKSSDAKKGQSIKTKGQERGTAKRSSVMEHRPGHGKMTVEEQKSQIARASTHGESFSKDRMHGSPMEDEWYDYRNLTETRTSRRRSKLLPYNADLFKMYRRKANVPGSVDSGAAIEEHDTLPSGKMDAYESQMKSRHTARQDDAGLGTDIDSDLVEGDSSVQYASMKHDEDSGLGHTSDDTSSYLGKPGHSLMERGMTVLSPVKSAEDITIPENWRKFFDTPSAQHRRIVAESEQQREKEGGDILPPIRYLDSKTEMVPGEPGMRLLRAITLAENGEEAAKRLQIESVPGKLGIDTSPQDTGLSRFGILNMQWTTDIPRPGYSERRTGSRIKRPQLFMSKTELEPNDKGHIFSSGLKPFPIESYPSSDHFLPDLLQAKTKNTPLYAWQKPIPPPPRQQPFTDTVPRKVPVHSCDYSKLLKKRMHEHCSQPGQRSFLPNIGASVAKQPTQDSGQGCRPSDDLSSCSRSDISPGSTAFLNHSLPPVTLKMLVVKT